MTGYPDTRLLRVTGCERAAQARADRAPDFRAYNGRPRSARDLL